MIDWAFFFMAVAAGLFASATYWALTTVRDFRVDHAKCIAHIASVTSNRAAAEVLRRAADDFESVEGMADLTRIRNTSYTEGVTVTGIWLREQADRIEGS